MPYTLFNKWTEYFLPPVALDYRPAHSGVLRGGGGQGGHGPRAQALEGAPAQLVGPNFKKTIRPRQIRKVTSLQCWINPVAKVAYLCYSIYMGPELSSFFFACRFFCHGADAGFTTRGGGGRTPSPKGEYRVNRPMCRGGGGGGGADPSIGPRALETLGTPLPAWLVIKRHLIS